MLETILNFILTIVEDGLMILGACDIVLLITYKMIYKKTKENKENK